MQKGKIGFSLWLYPFISMWAAFIGIHLAPFIILAVVIVFEQDEWCTKQCLHAIMFNIYWAFYNWIFSGVTGFIGLVPFLGDIVNIVFYILNLLVYIAMLVCFFLLGLNRLKNGNDIGLPGKGAIDRAFGVIQNNMPQYGAPQGGYAPPQGGYAPPQQGGGYPPQGGYGATPPAPPAPGYGATPPAPPAPNYGATPPPPPPAQGDAPPPPPPPPAQ